MARKLSERSQAVVFLVILGVVIAALYGWAQSTQPPTVRSEVVRGVSLVIDGVNWTIRYGPVTTANNTVYGLLLEASQRLHFAVVSQPYTLPAGILVVSINGSANTPSGPGWQYWVGTTYGDRGANLYPLSDGSNVTWRYVLGQGGG